MYKVHFYFFVRIYSHILNPYVLYCVNELHQPLSLSDEELLKLNQILKLFAVFLIDIVRGFLNHSTPSQ